MGLRSAGRLAAIGLCVAGLGSAKPAHADVSNFVFSGNGISAWGSLTYQLNTVSGDPSPSWVVTGATGTFSDSNIGYSNWTITGVQPLVGDVVEAGLPKYSSYYHVATQGVLPADDVDSSNNPALSYDNLLYLSTLGSPDICNVGAAGGQLDVLGILFTLQNGSSTAVVDVWSDGHPTYLKNGTTATFPGYYGAAVVNGSGTPIDYQDPYNSSAEGLVFFVPEPASLALGGVFLFGTLVGRRKRTS